MTKDDIDAIRQRNADRRKLHDPPAGYVNCPAKIRYIDCCLNGAVEDIDTLLSEVDRLNSIVRGKTFISEPKETE